MMNCDDCRQIAENIEEDTSEGPRYTVTKSTLALIKDHIKALHEFISLKDVPKSVI
jgi:hypothetical protein